MKKSIILFILLLLVFTAGCSASAIYEFGGITTWTGDVVTD